MTPYYADDLVTIYHGDALGADAPWLATDVLITDPPYGVAFRSGHWPADFAISGDADVSARDRALALWGDRPAAVFGTWRAPRPTGTRQRLIWDKSDGVGPGMGDLTEPFGPADEEIYLLGEWPKRTKRSPNVLRTAVGMRALAIRIGHPTPKPVGLLIRLIDAAPPGIIADPFLGSGSTLVAAKSLGRKAVGVEIEERYCEIAANRCRQDVLGLSA